MKTLIIILCFPTLLYAQEFQFRQEYDTIPVEIDGWKPFTPWTGGLQQSEPALADIDSDGDLDLFMGQFSGNVSYFKNIGSNLIADFNLITYQFDSLYSLTNWGRSSPDFCDLDDDGDLDAIIGSGYVALVNNLGDSLNPNFYASRDTLFDTNGNVVFGTYVTLIDIDADNDMDLICGEWMGHLQFYRNIGTPDSFSYYLESNPWLGINVGIDGYADPTFTDIDADGDYDLFIGERYGKIWYYRNDGDSANYNFTFVTNNYNNIDVGDYASPEFADIDGDGDYDLLVGRECPGLTNSPGDIFYYENIGTSSNAQWQLITKNFISLDVGYDAQGTTTDIDADNDHDLFIRNSGSYLSYYQDVGTPDSAAFCWVTDTYQNIHVSFGSPFFCDINGDTAPDLFLGEAVIPNPPYPNLYLYLNQGTPRNASFTSYTSIVPNNYSVDIRPALADIDADGDKDLFISTTNGYYYFYENVGTPTQAQFVYRTDHWQGLTLPSFGWPSCFYDIDHDGDLDLFLSNGNQLRFYRNRGTPQNAQMILETYNFLGEDHLPLMGIDIFDIDQDGDGDFMLTTGDGGMVFFRNITDTTAVPLPGTAPARPCKTTLSIGTNPANPVTAISYKLQAASVVNLSVYDIAGRKIASLVSGKLSAGDHTVSWDATGNASGVYLVRLETSGSGATPTMLTKKVVVVK